jgi:hypothetical protein
VVVAPDHLPALHASPIIPTLACLADAQLCGGEAQQQAALVEKEALLAAAQLAVESTQVGN